MNLLVNLSNRLSLVYHTVNFLRKHLMIILGLGLIAAFGRVIQLEGFGPITSRLHIFLEVVVEFVRLLIFLYVLGLASFRDGVLRIKRFFTDKISRKLYWRVALQKVRKQWVEILFNFFVFLGIASLINYLIDLLAYQTCLYLSLKKNEILNQASSEWAIILFFKNLSTIPFMLTFEALLLLWMINKTQGRKMASSF